MIGTKKWKVLDHNFIREVLIFLYIASAFFNSKLNMKISYILLIFFVINYLFMEKSSSKLRISIYNFFSIAFILGIIWNYFSSGNRGVSEFININGRFLYGFILYNCLNKISDTKKKYVTFTIILCTNILAIVFLYFKLPFLLHDDLGRFRIILSIGFIYTFIYNLEKIFFSYKYSIFFLTLVFPIFAIIKSGSRMTAIVLLIILFFYFIFKIFQNKKNTQKIFFFSFLLASSLIILPNNYIKHLKTSIQTTSNISNEARIIMWKAGVDIFKNNMILGVGSSERDIYPHVKKYVEKNIENKKLKDEFLRGDRFAKLHNMYIDFFVQNGILGFMYVYILLYKIPSLFFKNSQKNIESIATFFTILFYCLYGLTWSIWSSIGISQTVFHIILAYFLINIEEKDSISLL